MLNFPEEILSNQSFTIWGLSHREDNGDPNRFVRRANRDSLKLTNIHIHRTGSMKYGWVIISGSSVCSCNESGAGIRGIHDVAQSVIVNVVVGREF